MLLLTVLGSYSQILFLILDNTLMPLFKMKGTYPSLIFIFALCYSIVSSPRDAIIIGVFTGALQDVYFFNGFGINMLSNMLMCFVASYIGKSIFIEKSFLPVISSFILSVVKGLIVFCVMILIEKLRNKLLNRNYLVKKQILMLN